MMAQERRLVVIQESIDVVLRHLAVLPLSDRREQLHAWVQECLEETEQWSASPPTHREYEGLMKRVLEVRIGVAKLEREAPVVTAKNAS
jgi:hypothetical protein